MIRSFIVTLAPAVILGAVTMGCSSNVEVDAESGGGAISVGADKHRSEVASCNRQHAGSDAAALECLAKANDHVLDRLGENLTEVDKGSRERAESALLSFRSASELVCQHSADVAAKGKEEAARTSCLREREGTAAALIDAFASLGLELEVLDEPRTQHPDCFQSYDRRGTQSQQVLRAATNQLANCIDNDVRFIRGDYADPTVENHPGLTREDVLSAVDRNIERTIEASSVLCAMLADAGENGGELAKIDVALCRVDAGAGLYALITSATKAD